MLYPPAAEREESSTQKTVQKNLKQRIPVQRISIVSAGSDDEPEVCHIVPLNQIACNHKRKEKNIYFFLGVFTSL